MVLNVLIYSHYARCAQELDKPEKSSQPLKPPEDRGILFARLRPLGSQGPAREGVRIYAERRSGGRKAPLLFSVLRVAL